MYWKPAIGVRGRPQGWQATAGSRRHRRTEARSRWRRSDRRRRRYRSRPVGRTVRRGSAHCPGIRSRSKNPPDGRWRITDEEVVRQGLAGMICAVLRVRSLEDVGDRCALRVPEDRDGVARRNRVIGIAQMLDALPHRHVPLLAFESSPSGQRDRPERGVVLDASEWGAVGRSR